MRPFGSKRRQAIPPLTGTHLTLSRRVPEHPLAFCPASARLLTPLWLGRGAPLCAIVVACGWGLVSGGSWSRAKCPNTWGGRLPAQRHTTSQQTRRGRGWRCICDAWGGACLDLESDRLISPDDDDVFLLRTSRRRLSSRVVRKPTTGKPIWELPTADCTLDCWSGSI